MASAVEQQQQQQQRPETGFYCSTSGTYFSDKESLAEHYKSDFHRYNLKRKVAGLPPVTKEWFEARKAQLSTAAAAPHTKVWYDPLTKKKFQTQQTYQAHVNSKKYQQLVRDSGEPAPAPVIMVRQQRDEQQAEAEGAAAPAQAPAGPKPTPAAGFTVKAPARTSAAAADGTRPDGGQDEEGDEASSGWETASEADEEEEQGGSDGEWADWDPCVSFFDNKVSASMEDNLQYMYKCFGFFLPDAQFLADPEGLIKYLGAKLSMGKVPLYTAGDDPNAKQFRSLHAVQRHMVDTNQCRMLFDGNEEEYEDFYDYSPANGDAADAGDADADDAGPSTSSATAADASSKQLALAFDGLSLGSSGAAAAGGWELALPGDSSGAGGGKVLGSRELARYYRQRPKPQDSRRSVVVNTIIAQYRSMGLATQTSTLPAVERAAQRQQQRMQKRTGQLLYSRNNVNFNLPKNVTF